MRVIPHTRRPTDANLGFQVRELGRNAALLCVKCTAELKLLKPFFFFLFLFPAVFSRLSYPA